MKDETPKEKEKRLKREISEKKPKKKSFREPLPERKKYEMLCRGEGIKMVRTAGTLDTEDQFVQHSAPIAQMLPHIT